MMVGSRSTAEGDVDWDKPSTAVCACSLAEERQPASRLPGEIMPLTGEFALKTAVSDRLPHREAFLPSVLVPLQTNSDREPVRDKIRCRKDSMSFGSLVFTPLVKKLQERYGSRRQYERMENSGGSQDRFTPFESEFLAQRDSFYLATTGSTGWPYVQHRGGPKGFLKVIDDHTLAFGDFRGQTIHQHREPAYRQSRRDHHGRLSAAGPA